MDQKEILNFCLERGILLDKDVLNLFTETTDFDSVRLMIEKIQESTHKKIITKNVFVEGINKIGTSFPENSQNSIEKLKIRLGLELEISKEISIIDSPKKEVDFNNKKEFNVKISQYIANSNKKLEVDDFVSYFRSRFSKMKSILQSHSNLKNLVSINKISGDRQGISIIGIVSDKRITKNGNILFNLEDLTGNIRVLINQNKQSLYNKAEDITLDSIVGISGSGNKEIIFANDIIFPDSMLNEKKKSPVEEYALFISDVQFGNKLFLKNNFLKFIDYLNGKIPNTPEVNKIKYLFIVGDLIDGLGVYPEQEKDLEVKDIEEQFKGIAELLSRIRKDIAIIISPGNHDGVRMMEPQPFFDKKYAWPLYMLENVFLATNPCYVNIGEQKGFPGIDILLYHGYSYLYYADNIPSLIKSDSKNSPDKIMAYLLMNRHLAPTHSSVQYFPSQEDFLVIDKVPDIFVSGHIHKCAISFYNNTLLISTAAWEGKTALQEKVGNEPDFSKIPIYNLKTGGIKILDFEGV